MNRLIRTAIAATVAFTAVAAAHGRPVTVRGNLMTSDTSGAVYEITSEGGKTLLTNPAYATSYAASGGGTYNEGRYYMSKIWMSGYSAQTYVFDTGSDPWTTVTVDGDGSSTILSTDYAYDREADVIYGFHKQSGTRYVIGKITPGSTWSRKLVQVKKGPDMVDVTIDCADPDNRWHGLAFDSANQLWVITFGGVLNKVDKETGAMTPVGDTGIKPDVNGSAAFDMRTGKLYWAVKNSSGSHIYEVDTATAAATKVMDVPDNTQMTGIYIPEPAAEDGAPASPANIRYSFENGSLSGSLLFDIPAFTFNDTPATGSVNYHVTIGDGESISGSASFGDTGISVPFSVAASGTVETKIYLENNVGRSPVATHEGYVGYGIPENPSGLAVSFADGMMRLTWNPVEAVRDNEGYLGDVKYSVARISGGTSETVADNVSGTSFEEEIEEPESGLASYTYSVTAVNGDMMSETVTSPSLTLGTLALPYENCFDTVDDFRTMTCVNVEPKSKTWVYNTTGKNVTIGYDREYTKDDWLITPPIQFVPNYIYTVSVNAKSQSASYKERIGLAWGNEPAAEGMTNVIIYPEEEVPTQATDYSGSFQVEDPVRGYVGIHACSGVDKSTLTVDDLRIEGVPLTSVGSVTEESALTVSVASGYIVMSGCGNAYVAATDGRIVWKGEINGETRIGVAPGIYIVSAGGLSSKIAVR